jgi:hypothetical protein
MTIAIIGAIAGALLGMRFRVLALFPAMLFAILLVIATGHGRHLLAVVLTALATIAALQIGYMAGCVVRVKIATSPPAPSSVHFPSVSAKGGIDGTKLTRAARPMLDVLPTHDG